MQVFGMKSILPKIIIFGISILFFTIGFIQIHFGYVLSGRTGNQQKIYMLDDPKKFWAIASIQLIIGLITFFYGVLYVRQEKVK
jgi:hypothetical protein